MATPRCRREEQPVFAAELTPYRSLGIKGFKVSPVHRWPDEPRPYLRFRDYRCLWPIVFFFGLDFLLLFGAFWLNYRSARAREEVSVSRTDVSVRKFNAGGPDDRASVQSVLGAVQHFPPRGNRHRLHAAQRPARHRYRLLPQPRRSRNVSPTAFSGATWLRWRENADRARIGWRGWRRISVPSDYLWSQGDTTMNIKTSKPTDITPHGSDYETVSRVVELLTETIAISRLSMRSPASLASRRRSCRRVYPLGWAVAEGLPTGRDPRSRQAPAASRKNCRCSKPASSSGYPARRDCTICSSPTRRCRRANGSARRRADHPLRLPSVALRRGAGDGDRSRLGGACLQ
jgi:hypothetical protein